MRQIFIALLLTIFSVSAFGETKQGDVNKDGKVDISDVTMLIDIILKKQEEYDKTAADVNKDSKIDITDVTTLIDIILDRKPGTETGDFDDDPATGPANAPKQTP